MFSIFSQFIFGSSSLFGARDRIGTSGGLWKDKSLCFDMRQSNLELDHNEQLIARFFPIEDTKGNQDELGILEVTNLRLIWICGDRKRINLSIGWRTVSLAFEQNLKDPMGAQLGSLCVMSKFDSTKYEFVFNKMPTYVEETRCQEAALSILAKWREEKWHRMSHLTPMYLAEPFEVVFKVWHAYRRTQLFRHCRTNLSSLLSTVTTEHSSQQSDQAGDFPASTDRVNMGRVGEINRLPSEDVLNVYAKVHLCESKGVRPLGKLILTNIRLIWIDEALPLHNFSIPYIRVESLKFKQNEKILIHTYDYLVNTHQLELRLPTMELDASSKIKSIYDQIQNYYQLFKSKPRFGPESCEECLDYMALLRPIDQFTSNHMPFEVGNFGPQLNRDLVGDGAVDLELKDNSFRHLEALQSQESDDWKNAVDRQELELNKYSTKISNYLNEQPAKANVEIIYSPAFGLAFERPDKDMDLDRIWRMDL